MKAYERVLGSMAGWFSSEGFWLIAFIAFMVGIAVLDERSQTTDMETKQVTWCLDNGGRTVEIDGITNCFELTEVFPAEDCNNSAYVMLPSPGTGNLTCYEFKIVR